VIVGDVGDVSEAHSASIFRVEICRLVSCCVYIAFGSYSMGQGNERQNKATTRNAEAEQTNTQKEEKLAGTSGEDATRKSPKQLSYYQPIGRRDPGRPRRRWLDV
jgi:hypothetical protein